jgi:hypothetical protein
MAFCLPFLHKFEASVGPGSGYLYQRCAKCGRVRVRVAPPLLDQMPPRLDQDPNPRRWIPGPGVSSGGEVGVRNPVLARGFANDDF